MTEITSWFRVAKQKKQTKKQDLAAAITGRREQSPGQFRMILKFYIWLMGWSGTLSAWAWRKQAKIIRGRRPKKRRERFDDLE